MTHCGDWFAHPDRARLNTKVNNITSLQTSSDAKYSLFNYVITSIMFLYITKIVALKCYILFFFFFCIFRAAPVAYAGSQARGPIGAVATGLCHSHTNEGSEPHLQPTPQLTTTPDT